MGNNINTISNINVTMCNFWNSFGLPAYVEGYVPKGINYSYITYTFTVSDLFMKTAEKACIYTFSGDFEEINEICGRIADALPAEGVMLELPDNGGHLRLSRSANFCKDKTSADNLVKIREIGYLLRCYTDV
jgi:hypothetical protein